MICELENQLHESPSLSKFSDKFVKTQTMGYVVKNGSLAKYISSLNRARSSNTL